MTATTHSSTWLIFRIGRVACAVPALAVDSILPVPEHITAVPGADAGNPGLFHHSSGTMAVIDLRHRFGCEAPDPKRGRLLLGHVSGRGYGFWVDGVVGLADADQVKPAPLPPELPHNVFTAALRHHDEIVLCSDLARLLAMRDAGGLRHLVCAAPPAAAATTEPAGTPPPPRAATPSARESAPLSPIPAPAPPGTVAPPSAPPPAPRPAPPLPPRHTTPVRPAAPAPATPGRAAIRTAPAPATKTAASRAAPAPEATTVPPRAAPAPRAPSPARPEMPAPVPVTPMAPIPPAPAPAGAPSRLWLLLLLVAGVATGGFWLWPEEQTAQPPRIEPPPVVYMAPAPTSAPKSEPEPAPAPVTAPMAAAAPAATPLFQGDGIQVEQNGADITIIIDRAKTEAGPPPAAAEPEPMPVPGAGAEAEAETPPIAPAPEPAPPASAPQQMYVHTVVRGDTLWDIAERYLDDPWRYKELAQLSRIRNPDLIYPGNKVRIIIR
jgi:chemotaxis signal transduction protein